MVAQHRTILPDVLWPRRNVVVFRGTVDPDLKFASEGYCHILAHDHVRLFAPSLKFQAPFLECNAILFISQSLRL